ncbi:MAG: hypothetical protein ABR912_06980 [Terracidiphilus sp.]
MATANIQIRAFWQWFEDHQSEFNSLSSPDEPFWDRAVEQIKKVDERLWIELSAASDAVREFIVTAEGHVEAFPVAEKLVNLAPGIDGWIFVALKPPMGFAFTTRYEGTLFEPHRMWFLPLESPSHPQEFGIRVGIQGLESMDERVACNAVLVILDTGLGERSAALDIQYIKVSELPPDPGSLGYIELPELPAYIAWRKRTSSSQSG